jgi:predicted GNAT superfamily acetyltransferase
MKKTVSDIQLMLTRATEADVSAMASLEASWNYRQLPSNALSETGALFVPLGDEGLKRILADKDSCILTAKDSEKLCGMLVACGKALALEMWPHLSSDYAPTNFIWSEPFMYVKTVAVDPARTGHRVGTALVKEFRDIATSANQKAVLAVIAVEPGNKRSVALFKDCLGCQEIGRHYDEEKKIIWGLFKSIALN